MKLVKLKCPQCNANLEVNNDLTMAVCNYCGCSFYIDDEQVKQSQEATRKKKARENASAHAKRTVGRAEMANRGTETKRRKYKCVGSGCCCRRCICFGN